MSEALLHLLLRRIAAAGPISVAEYMTLALWHPEHGYYRRHDPLGRGGDFVTAPEVSQMFGELIGLWAAVAWRQAGAPAAVALVELGPGRGTLMADALRAARAVPGFLDAARIHLVEVNPALRACQRAALPGFGIRWHTGLADLPDGPAIVLANEYFDALPVHQLQREAGVWREWRVTADRQTGALAWALAPGESPLAALLAPAVREGAGDGTIAELSPAARGQAGTIAARLARDGGAALIVDYGRDRPGAGASLQAVRRHRRAAILDCPGSIDLSAHVDFPALTGCAEAAGARAWGPVGQGRFLRALGIEARAERLCRGADAARAAAIHGELHRLIDTAEMGRLFKAVALTAPDAPPPPGFAAGL